MCNTTSVYHRYHKLNYTSHQNIIPMQIIIETSQYRRRSNIQRKSVAICTPLFPSFFSTINISSLNSTFSCHFIALHRCMSNTQYLVTNPVINISLEIVLLLCGESQYDNTCMLSSEYLSIYYKHLRCEPQTPQCLASPAQS